MPCFLKSDKNWAIDAISKKTSAPPYFQIYSSFPPFETFFLEIVSIAQFLSEIKKQGIKMFRRAIPFYPDPQKIGIHHIRGGGGASIFRLPLKNCSYENWRARPHLMWWIPIFWYLDRRRLLFWTIWCLLFRNRRKIERLTQFPKKLPPPPLFSDIFQFSTIWDFFF